MADLLLSILACAFFEFTSLVFFTFLVVHGLLSDLKKNFYLRVVSLFGVTL